VSSILSAAQQPEQEASLLLCNDGSRPQVILAEDSTAARILTAVLLRRMGCDVDAVEHGEEALSRILSRAYDVIILDIEMPVMDGVTAARNIRDLGGAVAATPIVAFSAFLADTQAHMVRDLFDGILAKPAGRQALRTLLRKVLAARPDNSAGPSAPIAPIDPVLAPADAGAGCLAGIRSEFPNHVWRDLLATAVSEFKQDLGAAFCAFSAGEFEQLRYRCHIIKGVARTFAAADLAEIADAIENQIIAQQPRDLAGQLNRLKSCAERTLKNLSSLRGSPESVGR
jgi:CheY-like chemotaxis protein/HPt (histidine-containing phosphotransfer) domain-containing protein